MYSKVKKALYRLAGWCWGKQEGQIKRQPGEQGTEQLQKLALGRAWNRAKEISQRLLLHPTGGIKSGTQGLEELGIY